MTDTGTDGNVIWQSLLRPEKKAGPKVMVVAATSQELGWVDPPPGLKPDFPLILEAGDTLFVVTGPGPANTALAIGRALAFGRPELILNVGIGGAYPGSALQIGDLAVATVEIDHDTGTEPKLPGGPPGSIGVPTSPGSAENLFAADRETTELLLESCKTLANCRKGAFVTSAMVTSSQERAERIAANYSAICENMEGAGAARAALYSGSKFVEVRAISNMVGPRDKEKWKIPEAIELAGQAAKAFLATLTS